MAGPIDAIMAFHNAFRRDIVTIDTAALAWAREGREPAPALERFRFFNEALVWHATGEEMAMFPALEEVAPSVAEAYERDHRGLDAAYEVLSGAVSAGDPLDTARATAAFKFHLDIHLAKEDSHLYRLIRERVSEPDQYKAIGIMAHSVPQERFPEAVAWLFPLLGPNDRQNLTAVWERLMPPEVFAGVKQLIERAVGEDRVG
jgi:hypothetical protein